MSGAQDAGASIESLPGVLEVRDLLRARPPAGDEGKELDLSTSDNDSPRAGVASSPYSGQKPTRDHPDWAEWQRASAEDHASAIEERLSPEQEFERYEGPLNWYEFLQERAREQHLRDVGIGPVELPDPYREALGPRRAELLEREVEDLLARYVTQPRSAEELGESAQQLSAAAATLNLELSRQVSDLEERGEEQRDLLNAAVRREADLSMGAEDAKSDVDRAQFGAHAELEAERIKTLRQSRQATSRALDEFAARPDHPDRWAVKDGSRFADALAAKITLGRDVEAELGFGSTANAPEVAFAEWGVETTPEGPGQELPIEPVPRPPDVGLDLG